MITIDWFEKWAGYASDKVAVTQFETGQSLTYGQLNNLGGHVCRHFKDEYQLTKGDRVGILAENCLQYIILLAAAQKSGIILVPLNYRLTPREIDFLVGDCEPVLLIVEDKFVDKLTGSPATAKVPYQLSLSDFAAFTDELDLTQTPDYTPIPALIIFGENDNLIPNRFLNPGKTSKVAQVGKERLPNSKLVMIPKAGHFVQFEKSGEVNNAIKAFLL